jgi:amino acid transporter
MARRPEDRSGDKRTALSFGAAVSLGIGVMIGAGIFALLGEAGSLAGSAVWISFVVAGIAALLAGYSLGKLGARYPSAGGMVEYLIHGYGDSLFAGASAVMMYLAALISLSLVAKTFGAYGAALVGAPGWLAPILAVVVMIVFVAINLRGAASVGRIELWIVLIKLAVLVTLAVGGLAVLKPGLLAPSTYPPAGSILASIAVTFFAYEGFRVITNAAEDVDDPKRTIPRAIMTAILIVMVLYVVISVVVFGTMTPEAVTAAKDHALAEAARPVFGSVGVVAVSITALIATASAINAGLFSATNVSYQMAKDGELPGVLGRPIRHSREGLLVSGFIVAVFSVSFDLGQVAVLGAIAILLVQATVHIGHLRIARETGANRFVVGLAAAVALGIVALTLVDSVKGSSLILVVFGAFVVVSFVGEWLFRRVGSKSLSVRVS